MIKVEVEGTTYEYDNSRLMLSEAQALQDKWGLDPEALKTILAAGSAGFTELAAVVWIVKVRALAAEQGISFRAASTQLPPADFDFDLSGLRVESEQEAPNPTAAGTPAKGTRTTRATSARPRAKRS